MFIQHTHVQTFSYVVFTISFVTVYYKKTSHSLGPLGKNITILLCQPNFVQVSKFLRLQGVLRIMICYFSQVCDKRQAFSSLQSSILFNKVVTCNEVLELLFRQIITICALKKLQNTIPIQKHENSSKNITCRGNSFLRIGSDI